MIRGSIEAVDKTRVAGWIYSGAESVRDKTILAFVGNRCVGACKVDKFRKDLLEAKLGDGYCGFDFAIKLQEGENLGAVIVKLQNADVALIQRTSRLVGPNDEEGNEAPDLGAIAPASVSWFQDRGWLDQPEYDFLRAVQNTGAYERGLRAPRRGGDLQQMLKPEAVVQDLLSIYTLGDVDVSRTTISAISDLAGETSLLRTAKISVVALWSAERGRISLDERSHLGDKAGRGLVLPAVPAGGIDYSFGPDRVLFLHKDCSFAPQGAAPAGGITVLTASVRSTSHVTRIRPERAERAA